MRVWLAVAVVGLSLAPSNVTETDPSNNRASDVDGVPGACGLAADVHLSDQSVNSTTSFEACHSLSAGDGFDVLASADVTFRSGDHIALRDGFVLRSDARLTIIIDISLLDGPP